MMKKYEPVENTITPQMSYQNGNMQIVFPMVEGNSDYAEYLRYTAWVEAGNNPEDFWTQSEVN